MKKNKNNRKQRGFTLIELLVAITIFAVFIVVSSGSLVDVIRTEQKGNVLRKTLEDTRNILETISRDSRESNGELDLGGTRVGHAYVKNGDNLEVYATTTDGKVEKTVYSYISIGGSIPNTIQKAVYKKSVGADNSTYTLSGALINLNDYNQVIISSITFTVSGDLTNLLIPPELKININAESGSGMTSGKSEFTAKVNLETLVTPRSY